MSRIGKKPIKVPSGVKIELTDSQITISAASKSLVMPLHSIVSVKYDQSQSEILVTRENNERFSRAMHGTTRALIANMVQGVLKEYTKELAIYGTGYGIKEQQKELLLTLGFAQPARIAIPVGVTIEIKAPSARGNDVPALFTVVGADKASVGQFAAQIRKLRPPEPYKGKGIRYADEVVKRKVGKAFASA